MPLKVTVTMRPFSTPTLLPLIVSGTAGVAISASYSVLISVPSEIGPTRTVGATVSTAMARLMALPTLPAASVAVALIVGYAQAKLFKRVYGALMLSTSAGLAFISALAAVLISFGACLVAGLVLGGAFFAYVLSVLVGHVVLFVWLQRRETKA